MLIVLVLKFCPQDRLRGALSSLKAGLAFCPDEETAPHPPPLKTALSKPSPSSPDQFFLLFLEMKLCKSRREFLYENVQGASGNSIIFSKPNTKEVAINVLPSLRGHKLKAGASLREKWPLPLQFHTAILPSFKGFIIV